jgi:uncharacterized membrane protein
MRFVVVIPLWVYFIYALVAISAASAVLYIILVLSFIYMLLTQPRQVAGFLFGIALLSLALQYWKVSIILAVVALISKYHFRNKSSLSANQKLIEMSDGSNSHKDLNS